MAPLAHALLIAAMLAIAAPAHTQTTPVPPPTDEERKAAFPADADGHAVHDNGLHFMVLVDDLEWHVSEPGVGAFWQTNTWVGGDINRIWIRTQGDVEGGDLEDAEAHLMLGRNFSRWWSLVGGVRQDFTPGPGRTWAAVGLQGLAPQRFQVEATVYLGESARTAARVEVEYDWRFTDRLIMQPQVEVNVMGKGDPERRIGVGLNALQFGVRLRYEIQRELAPYVGLVWNRKMFGTADLARAAGHGTGGWRFVSGLRFWF